MRSPKLGLVAAIALPLLFAPAAYVQAQAIKTETVNFDAGTSGTVLKNTLKGEQIVDYKLGASAGQLLSVELTTNNASNYFNIMAPGADAALFIGSTEGTRYSGALPSSGEYTLRVYLMRNAARRNEAATYDLAISVTDGSGQAANTAQPADFADGLSGGPDMREVSELSAGDTLNLHAGTGTGFDVLAKLATGAVLENLGCQMQDDMRWCQVKRPSDGVSGWVSGRFLVESGASSSGSVSGNNDVPELHARNSGEIEVRFGHGCTALYNPAGRRINAGSSCSRTQLTNAHDAVERYMRENGSAADHSGGSSASVAADVNTSGNGVIYGGGATNGRIFGHKEGAYALTVSGDGMTCTGLLQHAPGGVRSQTSSIHCTNGASGSGVLVTNRSGKGHTLTFTLTHGSGGYVIFG